MIDIAAGETEFDAHGELLRGSGRAGLKRRLAGGRLGGRGASGYEGR
jgi:hypothetical protein